MTAYCTFSGATVPIYRWTEWHPIGVYVNEITLDCRTPTFSVITSLQALQGHIGLQIMASGKVRIQTTGGTKASLVLNGTTYTNCYISDIRVHEPDKSLPFTQYEFTIRFVQETV
jgi:hypothetical protein